MRLFPTYNTNSEQKLLQNSQLKSFKINFSPLYILCHKLLKQGFFFFQAHKFLVCNIFEHAFLLANQSEEEKYFSRYQIY